MIFTGVSSYGRNLSDHSQGRWVKFLIALCAAAILLSTTVTQASERGGRHITQRQFLSMVAELSGSGGDFNSSSTDQDVLKWASDKGLKGNWDLKGTMTKDKLAQSMVDLLKLDPKSFGGNLEKILKRHGITLPKDDKVSRKDLIKMTDDYKFLFRVIVLGEKDTTPTKPGDPIDHDKEKKLTLFKRMLLQLHRLGLGGSGHGNKR